MGLHLHQILLCIKFWKTMSVIVVSITKLICFKEEFTQCIVELLQHGI